MKTLYISDVDGTLYRGGEASLRDQTRELFSRLLQTGTAVTIASGRNLYGIYDIATESGITLPVIAYNGAAVYDFHKGKAVKIFPMERKKTRELCQLFEDVGHRYKACVFFEEEQRCLTFNQNGYRSQLWTDLARHPQNGLLYDEPVLERSISEILSGECLYIGTSGTYEQLLPIHEKACTISGVQSVMHRSPYDENKWFVDIGSDKAGKGAAALFLKEMVGAEELVTFGDNHNDIPMLEAADRCYTVPEAADRCYTVPEAPEEVKAIVNGVLDDDPDCVLKFLLKEVNQQA